MDELRPCPFCGGEAFGVETHPGAGFVQCSKCGCAMDEYEAGDPETLTEHWNRRTVDREALLALACELDEVQRSRTTGIYLDPMEAARRIREACGEPR